MLLDVSCDQSVYNQKPASKIKIQNIFLIADLLIHSIDVEQIFTHPSNSINVCQIKHNKEWSIDKTTDLFRTTLYCMAGSFACSQVNIDDLRQIHLLVLCMASFVKS